MAEGGCGRFDAVAAEVALGVADSQERSAAIAHVEHCARCRQELLRLSDAADGLLGLVPPVDPPAGFESRVLTRLTAVRGEGPEAAAGAGGPQPSEIAAGAGDPQPLEMAARRPLWRAAPARRRLVQVGAAIVAGLVVAAAGWAVGTRTAASPGRGVRAVAPAAAPAGGHVVRASLVADGRAVGDVVLRTGRDPWLSMAVQEPPGGLDAGTVTCRLRTRGGGTVAVGSFALAGGYGYWAAPVPTSRPVTAAQLVDPAGHVVASAVLPGPSASPRR